MTKYLQCTKCKSEEFRQLEYGTKKVTLTCNSCDLRVTKSIPVQVRKIVGGVIYKN